MDSKYKMRIDPENPNKLLIDLDSDDETPATPDEKLLEEEKEALAVNEPTQEPEPSKIKDPSPVPEDKPNEKDDDIIILDDDDEEEPSAPKENNDENVLNVEKDAESEIPIHPEDEKMEVEEEKIISPQEELPVVMTPVPEVTAIENTCETDDKENIDDINNTSKKPTNSGEETDLEEVVDEHGKEVSTLLDNLNDNKSPKTGSDIEEVLEQDVMDVEPTLPEPELDTKMEVDEETNNAFKNSHIDCINIECKKQCEDVCEAPNFILSYFKVPDKPNSKQTVCFDCFDEAQKRYETCYGVLTANQPIFNTELSKLSELVEIVDSDEDDDTCPKEKPSDEPLSDNVIDCVVNNLDSVIDEVMEKLNISQQLDWSKQIMQQRINNLAVANNDLLDAFTNLQKQADQIHYKLFSIARPKYQSVTAIDFGLDVITASSPSPSPQPVYQTAQSVLPITTPLPTLKKPEDIMRPEIAVGQWFYGVKTKLLNNWVECRVTEVINCKENTQYKVYFNSPGQTTMRLLGATHLAYRTPYNFKLPVGSRIICLFDQTKSKTTSQRRIAYFYPGIIAETLSKQNSHRYLVFFDDGFTQYVAHTNVRIVCKQSENVWEDCHEHSRDFFQKYLLNFKSQRPMVNVRPGQKIMTEYHGQWCHARVLKTDASLVELFFFEANHTEWIYRGSTRLGPLFKQQQQHFVGRRMTNSQKGHEPAVEYITLDEDDDEGATTEEQPLSTKQEIIVKEMVQETVQQTQNRAVARKSTRGGPPPSAASAAAAAAAAAAADLLAPSHQPISMNQSKIYCDDGKKGKQVFYTVKATKHATPQTFEPHECSPTCLFAIKHNLKSYNPLAKPLICGFERQLCKIKAKKTEIMYRAPCGRRLRNMDEVHYYIRTTDSPLNVDNFDFDLNNHCLVEYVIENPIFKDNDISQGRELMPVPCVNYFDDEKPPPIDYSTTRVATAGVNMDPAGDFLCACDCTDDCINKSTCQCWQLTVRGARHDQSHAHSHIDNIGYVYKRLYKQITTGVYECNAKCKCKANCLNRVVQHPLQVKLQLFKTNNRGWGIRCLNDVPRGTFICVYAGEVLTNDTANRICLENEDKAGDEYFADLDFIEVAEEVKEGYESDVASDMDSDGEDYMAMRDSDASDTEFLPTEKRTTRAKAKEKKKNKNGNGNKKESSGATNKRKSNVPDDFSDDGSRECQGIGIGSDQKSWKEFKGFRSLYGHKENDVFILDAKRIGNLGRYFNHSCSPNLFVQNVFVDSQDLRFPWVAFFTSKQVRSGTELTWDYSYEVGSAPGKRLICQCGAPNCRRILL